MLVSTSPRWSVTSVKVVTAIQKYKRLSYCFTNAKIKSNHTVTQIYWFRWQPLVCFSRCSSHRHICRHHRPPARTQIQRQCLWASTSGTAKPNSDHLPNHRWKNPSNVLWHDNNLSQMLHLFFKTQIASFLSSWHPCAACSGWCEWDLYPNQLVQTSGSHYWWELISIYVFIFEFTAEYTGPSSQSWV